MSYAPLGAHPGYAVRVQRVGIGATDDLEIRSLLDRQQYADPDRLAEHAGISSASWPLFGQIWPSALVLAELMQTWNLGTRRILEIGCGLALASLVIHRRQGNITASDNHPLAETFLQDNLLRNHLPPMKYATGNWLRTNPDLGVFDLMIGSDILYERDHPRRVADFIQHHAADHAEVVIIDPNRGNRAGFCRCLDKSGFSATERTVRSKLSDGSHYRGRMLLFQR